MSGQVLKSQQCALSKTQPTSWQKPLRQLVRSWMYLGMDTKKGSLVGWVFKGLVANERLDPKNGGLVQMIFLFKCRCFLVST